MAARGKVRNAKSVTKKPKRVKPPRRKGRKPPAPKPPTASAPPSVDFQTDERRERVLQLWGRKDKHVAKILLEEGFVVAVGERPLSFDLVPEWETRRLELMRRNVSNDRAWWNERWRKKGASKLSPEDAAVERESHVASLKSDIDEIQDLLVDPLTKATAKAMLVGERRQSRVAIAKARGIETLEQDEAGGDVGTPVVRRVLVLDLSRCSEPEKAKYGVGASGK
jgi:hypothetical protein